MADDTKTTVRDEEQSRRQFDQVYDDYRTRIQRVFGCATGADAHE